MMRHRIATIRTEWLPGTFSRETAETTARAINEQLPAGCNPARRDRAADTATATKHYGRQTVALRGCRPWRDAALRLPSTLAAMDAARITERNDA